MNAEFIPYFAGFFDGEGAIFVSKTHVRGYLSYRPRMEVSNTHLAVMETIAVELRTTISNRREFDDVRKTQYRVSVISWSECQALCETLLPFLLVKNRQAEIMLKWTTHRLSQYADYGQFHSTFTHEEHEWYEDLRTLNKRGADANVRT